VRRFVFILLLSAWTCSYGQAERELPDRYLFDQVMITGSTNMNEFHLDYRESDFSGIPSCVQGKDDTFRFLIPAGRIKAESKMMRTDFLEMIHADKYPDIVITLGENIVGDLRGSSILNHRIGLTLNGVTNNYQVKSVKEEGPSGQWLLSGAVKIRLSNFKIDPPKKFLGLVKVNDEVLINFKILFAANRGTR